MSFEFTPSAFLKRLFAITLAALPVVAVLVIAAGASLDLSAHHARLGVLRRERATYEQLLANQPRYAREIAEIEASGAEGVFFPPSPVSGAANEIQTAIAQAVKAAGASLKQAGVSAESQAANDFTGVSEHVALKCDIETLTHVLHQLALSRPALFVEHLAIDDPDKDSPLSGPHQLNIDMVVTGYVRAHE